MLGVDSLPAVAHVSPRNAVPPLSAANSFDSPDEHDERWDQIRTSQRFRSLDQDVQWYLNYHRSHITHHHYHLTHSSRNFVSYYLIEQSLTSDSLLYAIVTFTAYHYAVAMQDSRTAVYLGYYGKALNHLAQVIANRRKMRTQTLLTVLQLANFEVCRLSVSFELCLLTMCVQGACRGLGNALDAPKGRLRDT